MKTLITISSLLLALQAAWALPGMMGMNAAAIEDCRTTYPTTADDLTNFASTSEASDNLKCFMKCTLQAVGKMDADGTIAFRMLPMDMPETTKTAIEKCFGMTPTPDLCETAYLHNKCLLENDPEREFLKLFRQKGAMAMEN